jgi:hypothetical protein
MIHFLAAELGVPGADDSGGFVCMVLPGDQCIEGGTFARREISRANAFPYGECVFCQLRSVTDDILTFLRILERQLMKCAGNLGFLWGDETRGLAGRMIGGGTFLAAMNP